MILVPRHTVPKPRGQVIIVGPRGTQTYDTLRCVHCQAHWVVQPGSGRVRGWCLKCGGPTCGAPECNVCAPFEKKLELMESRPVVVGA